MCGGFGLARRVFIDFKFRYGTYAWHVFINTNSAQCARTHNYIYIYYTRAFTHARYSLGRHVTQVCLYNIVAVYLEIPDEQIKQLIYGVQIYYGGDWMDYDVSYHHGTLPLEHKNRLGLASCNTIKNSFLCRCIAISLWVKVY